MAEGKNNHRLADTGRLCTDIFTVLILLVLILGSCSDEQEITSSGKAYWQWDSTQIEIFKVEQLPEVSENWHSDSIPHKIFHPNRPIWYHKVVDAEPYQYMEVRADDGAQVYLNKKRIYAEEGYFYKLPEPKNQLDVMIRVMNNATYGGLKQINWLVEVPQAVFDSREEERGALKMLLQERSSNRVFLPKDTTMWPDRAKHRFAAWGDSQGGWGIFRQLCQTMAEVPRLDFALGLGDLVETGVYPKQWLSFMDCIKPLAEAGVHVFPVAGNHDYDGYYDHLVPELYKSCFLEKGELTYNTWVVGNLYFMALDPNGSYPLDIDTEQYGWALEVMNSNKWKSADWRFVLIHQPPFAQGWPRYEGDHFIREFVEEHAETYGIDIVLSGHCHDFEYLQKSYGDHQCHFIITGGGGRSLEPKENDDRIQMDTVFSAYHFLVFDVDHDEMSVSIRDTLGSEMLQLFLEN